MRPMLRIIMTCCLLFSSTSLFAFDLENGKALHDENCVRCHTDKLYTSDKAKITSYEKLHARVRQCELMAELTWFDDEIDDVTAYINANFYRFEISK